MKKPIILLSGPQGAGKTHTANAIKQFFSDNSTVALTEQEFRSILKLQPNLLRNSMLVDIYLTETAQVEDLGFLFDHITDFLDDSPTGPRFIVQSQMHYRREHPAVTEIECMYKAPGPMF
ncbi:MAG TPA: ATP-binding protein [Flavipsychrobacter sp.]|nr:ATP-binding protein [Flavipsychrobacter sp.]